LSGEKQPPPVKFKTKQVLWKVRRSEEPTHRVISKHQCYHRRGIPGSDCTVAIQ